MTGVAVQDARLWPWSLFAALIAGAGLPIYINAPKFYAESYGVNPASLGLVPAALRLIDVVQDPLPGWLAEVQRAARAVWVWTAPAVMALSMYGLFAVAPPFAPLIWFALMMVARFSAFSFLSIVFYAQGVDHAADLGAGGHLRLAGWRETGSLPGVCVAAIAPTLLAGVTSRPLTGFAIGFALLALVATAAMRGNWQPGPPRPASAPVGADPVQRG